MTGIRFCGIYLPKLIQPNGKPFDVPSTGGSDAKEKNTRFLKTWVYQEKEAKSRYPMPMQVVEMKDDKPLLLVDDASGKDSTDYDQWFMANWRGPQIEPLPESTSRMKRFGHRLKRWGSKLKLMVTDKRAKRIKDLDKHHKKLLSQAKSRELVITNTMIKGAWKQKRPLIMWHDEMGE